MRHVFVTQVPIQKEYLDSDLVFVMDIGHQIYQWNGSGANPLDIPEVTARVRVGSGGSGGPGGWGQGCGSRGDQTWICGNKRAPGPRPPRGLVFTGYPASSTNSWSPAPRFSSLNDSHSWMCLVSPCAGDHLLPKTARGPGHGV